MQKHSQNQAARPQEQMETVIRSVVRTRRHEEGFSQSVPSECWKSSVVSEAVANAAQYLAEQCCPAEVEALKDEPHPDDTELEAALQEVQRALNGLMVFTAHEPEPQLKRPAFSDTMPPEGVTACQASCEQTATDYFHWLLAGDSWVTDVRAGLPPDLSERQMLDLLLCPVRRVLSFRDYAELGFNPWLTTGRLCSEEVVFLPYQEAPPLREISVNSFPEDESEETVGAEERYQNGWGDEEPNEEEPNEVPARKITVELDCPDGSQVTLTVQRFTAHQNYTSYRVQGLDWRWNNISRVADKAALQKVWEQFRGDQPADKEQYPRFPQIFFSRYRDSVSGEVEALCDTMRENDFYPDTDAALRYLMMGLEAPLLGFRCTQDSPYHSDTQQFLRGRFYLTIPSWSLPEEVADYWRQVRPQTARERRLPTEEHLAMFAFVLKHTRPAGEPRWAELARLWEQKHGQPLTRDRLHRTFGRVRRALFPPYELTTKQQARLQELEDLEDAANEEIPNGMIE